MTAPLVKARPTFLGVVNGAVDTIVKLGVIGGLCFSALEYTAAQKRERVGRVGDYIERFETGELAASARTITSEVRKFSEREDFKELRLLAEADPAQVDAVRAQIAQILVYDVREGKGVADELDQLVSFYNGLQVCVEEKLCDARAAHVFFDGHAKSLYENFGPLFAERAQTWPGYGAGLQRFVGAASGA